MRVSQRRLRNIGAAHVQEGVRLLALNMLQQAESAFARLHIADDDEALHDFRVALRRLRSILEEYAPWLEESVTAKQRKRLRRIARGSNPSRDSEVLLALTKRLNDLSPEAAEGVARLKDALRKDRADAAHAFRSDVVRDFPRLARGLTLSLPGYTAKLRPAGSRPEPLSLVASRLVEASIDDLRRHLDGVLSVEHQEEAHDARIAAKRIRYLLEPFAAAVPSCAVAVSGLKVFQDSFGDLHDAHVLLTMAEAALVESQPEQRASLAAAHDNIRQLRQRLYYAVHRDHVESAAALLLDAVRSAARGLELATSHRHEIERKFLLSRMPRLRHAERLTITQGYLPGGEIRERIRRVKGDGGTRYFRTLKAGRGVDRLEIEEETTAEVFKRLYGLTKGQRVRKRRYRVEADGSTWEIDRFLDRDLVLAEIELPTARTPVNFPPWLRDLVVRDVTRDPDFSNERLAGERLDP